MTLIFMNVPGPWGWIIRLFTWSKWSHVIVLDQERRSAIGAWRGQGVVIDKYPTVLGLADSYEVIEIDVPRPAAAYEFLLAQVGKPYDMAGVFGWWFNRKWQDPAAWFCSELAAAAIQAGGRRLPWNWAHRISPGRLWQSVR